MVGYEKKINLNIHEFKMITLEMNVKSQKIKGYTYQMAHISVANCTRVPKHVTIVMRRQITLILLSDMKRI